MTTINQILRGFCVLCVSTASALAQCSFSSGSTGADGAFTPTNSMPSTGYSVSGNVVTVTNSATGIFNFTSVYIETNWTVKFTKNALNTPVYLLATNDVTIKGTIDLNGTSGSGVNMGLGGPGGFDGGKAGATSATTGSGFGPGAGKYIVSASGAGSFGFPGESWGAGGAGPTYGTIDIRPFIGGSGGAAQINKSGGGGGGGLLIASSTKIDVIGKITASGGGAGGVDSGAGSGGGISLIATTIQGEGVIEAPSAGSTTDGGVGRIRLEACQNRRLTLTTPAATFGSPGSVFLSTNPTIRVTSIAGQNTPSTPSGSLTVPDLNLPGGYTNPATINVAASNVNAGTTFTVILTPVYGSNFTASSTLSGVYTNSTGSVSMNVYTDRVWRVNALIDYIPRP
jgi:hypothetical protein